MYPEYKKLAHKKMPDHGASIDEQLPAEVDNYWNYQERMFEEGTVA